MSEFWEPKIKVCKVDTQVLIQKCWVGPSTKEENSRIIDKVGVCAIHLAKLQLLSSLGFPKDVKS